MVGGHPASDGEQRSQVRAEDRRVEPGQRPHRPQVGLLGQILHVAQRRRGGPRNRATSRLVDRMNAVAAGPVAGFRGQRVGRRLVVRTRGGHGDGLSTEEDSTGKPPRRGTGWRRPATIQNVRCEQCREALSARLDGEDEPAGRAAVDAHLDRCPDCRRFADDAAMVTRLTRMSVVEPSHGGDQRRLPCRGGDLGARSRSPPPGRWAAARARGAGIRPVRPGHGADQRVFARAAIMSAGDPVSSAHLRHESAAWNVALGAGFGWIAVRRSRPAGLVPC